MAIEKYKPIEANDIINELEELKNKIRINYIKPTLGTTTINGVTFTNNGDGTYTLNGTAIKDEEICIFDDTVNFNNVKLIGCPEGGSDTTYRMYMYWNNTLNNNAKDYGDGSKIVTINNVNLKVIINIYNGVIYNNIVFKPMITDDLSATYDDFVSWKDSNTKNNQILSYEEIMASTDLTNKVASAGSIKTLNDNISNQINNIAVIPTYSYKDLGANTTDEDFLKKWINKIWTDHFYAVGRPIFAKVVPNSQGIVIGHIYRTEASKVKYAGFMLIKDNGGYINLFGYTDIDKWYLVQK